MTTSIRDAIRDIIQGQTVKRSLHELTYHEQDYTAVFIEELQHNGFMPLSVNDVNIVPGTRIPAFYLLQHTAYFGWVFWEKFSQLRLRKLFGTVVRNAKGDWLYQLPSNSATIIYANTSQILEMDIDRPFEL